MINLSSLKRIVAYTGLAALIATSSIAHPASTDHQHDASLVHENGIGPDPDGDTNPATITRVVAFQGASEKLNTSAPYHLITFEPPPGRHGELIIKDYGEEFGATFSKGLRWQECRGSRHGLYDSLCVYPAPTSGVFAAVYETANNKPLTIEFEKPACLATMSIYPTGGEDGEQFTLFISGWDEEGNRLTQASETFSWQKNIVRFDNLAGAFFDGAPAKKLSVTLTRANKPYENIRFLIDDLGFVSEQCETAVADIERSLGVTLRQPRLQVNRSED